MKFFSYTLVRLLILFIGIIPFRLLYLFSDFVYLIIYYLIGYRRKVVLSNLQSSFPDKTPAEIKSITRKYYHHLCDISLESLKGFSMSAGEIVRRHHIINPELVDHYFNKNLSIIALPAHYNNWEWGSLSPGSQIKFPIVVFYKPMSNKLLDAFVKRHRAKFNTRLASIRETGITFDELASTPNTFIMASDQSPSNLKDCYWFDFLNHDTTWLHGPEKYARKYDIPLVYVDIQKVKRGFYTLEMQLLTENPSSLPEGEITRLYARNLEKTILHEPAFWLWSHKRWKHSRG